MSYSNPFLLHGNIMKPKFAFKYIIALLAIFDFLLAFDATNLPPVGYHPGGLAYYSPPWFANLLVHDARNWRIEASYNDEIQYTNEQINEQGLPIYLKTEQEFLESSVYMPDDGGWRSTPLDGNRHEHSYGKYLVVWEGAADVRLIVSSVDEDSYLSTGTPEEGIITNGRREYLVEAGQKKVQIHGVDSNVSFTSLKVYFPDPADPSNSTLEPDDPANPTAEEYFHPYFLEMVTERPWAYIRFMDWLHINANPQHLWSDRRLPDNAFFTGVISPASTVPGEIWYYKNGDTNQPVYFAGDKTTAVPLEYLILLCNAVGEDMWLNIPHRVTDEFITNMALMMKYGSDGRDPYTSDQTSPEYPPLDEGLDIYLEFANEIWSGGGNFPQGEWSRIEGAKIGLSKAQHNALMFDRAWNIFENHLGEDRIVRVAAVWTGNKNYTTEFLEEFRTNTDLLYPEAIAITTYFGHGMQHWAWQQNFNGFNSYNLSEDPHLDPYWTNSQIDQDMELFFKKWYSLALSGGKFDGDTGVDNVQDLGAFPDYLTNYSEVYNLPLIAYEGGPNFYTDALDRGAGEDDWITHFVKEMNRRDEIANVYKTILNQAFQKGLYSHMMFVDMSSWGKYGQWGHKEYLAQAPNEAPKLRALAEFYDEFTNIRRIQEPASNVPYFVTEADLDPWFVGEDKYVCIEADGGDGPLILDTIASFLPRGVSWDANKMALQGSPEETGQFYLYLRLLDVDRDPGWRIFRFQAVERSSLPAYTNDFEFLSNYGSGNYGTKFTTNLITGDYQIDRIDGSYDFVINGPEDNGWHGDWPSMLVVADGWPHKMMFNRVDGKPFDLFSFEAGSRGSDPQAKSVEVIASYPNGTVDPPRYYNLVPTEKYMTKIEVDLIGVSQVQFDFRELSNGMGDNRNGAIDNLLLNVIRPMAISNTNTECPCTGLPDRGQPLIDIGSVNPTNLNIGDAWVDPVTAYDVDGSTTNDLTGSILTYGTVDTSTEGQYELLYEVSDASGNVGRGFRSVIITNAVDSTPPLLSLKGESIVELDYGSTYYELGATAIDHRDGNLSASVQISGSNINTDSSGTNLVHYSVEDSSGNSSSRTRTVIIGLGPDVTPPVLNLLGDNPVDHYQDYPWTDPGASASDDRDGDLTSYITVSNSVDISTLGSYTLYYSVFDSAGNEATNTRVVKVVEAPDLTPPVISLNGGSNIFITQNDSWVDPGATATDDRDGDLSSSIEVIGSVDTSVLGTNNLLYRVWDSSFNTNSIIRKVIITEPDLTPPVIQLNSSNSIILDWGASWNDPVSAGDDVEGDLTASINVTPVLDTTQAGTNILRYNVSDSSGNAATEVTRTVIVLPFVPLYYVDENLEFFTADQWVQNTVSANTPTLSMSRYVNTLASDSKTSSSLNLVEVPDFPANPSSVDAVIQLTLPPGKDVLRLNQISGYRLYIKMKTQEGQSKTVVKYTSEQNSETGLYVGNLTEVMFIQVKNNIDQGPEYLGVEYQLQ